MPLSILSYGFFPYDGYYSETDRTGTVQKTIHSIQRPPRPPIIRMRFLYIYYIYIYISIPA